MILLANLALLVGWAWAHRDAIEWLAAQYVREDRRIEGLLLCGLLIVSWRRSRGAGSLPLDTPPPIK